MLTDVQPTAVLTFFENGYITNTVRLLYFSF